MRQAFFTQIRNIGADINESITMKDSLHGTSCSIQHFGKEYSSAHPRKCPTETKTTIRKINQADNSRSKSVPKAQNKSYPSRPQSWATNLKANKVYHNCQHKGDHSMVPCNSTDVVLDCVSVEKANSCPIKCACICSTGHASNHHIAVRSANVLQNSNSLPMSPHFTYTDGVVIQLKSEIENLRGDLEQIALKNDKKKEEVIQQNEKQIQQMKVENRHLKRDLELKRKNLAASLEQVEKAKDILTEYEEKMKHLHQQTLKSSKLVRQSKEKFCKCLKEKENIINELRINKEYLLKTLEEKDTQYQELNSTFSSLQGLIFENNEQFSVLSANNRNFSDIIKTLEQRVENSESECERYKEELKKTEQKMENLRCSTCDKLESKVKKQKEKYETRIKNLENKEKTHQFEMSELMRKLKDSETRNERIEELENRCNCLKAQITEYEKFLENYKRLEEEYNDQCRISMENDRKFENDRRDLRELVDELTNVVKQNKVTLLQLSQVNKEQEALLMSQSAILSEKDEQIKSAESEIEMLRQKGCQLEQDIEALKQLLDGPCSKETCSSLSSELEQLRTTLSEERDNTLIKDKIIEDQSQTISSLQRQIKEKISELNKAREESSIAEEEILQINDHLMKKHQEVEKQISEKELLVRKLKKLEYQKSMLSNEMAELEILLSNYSNSQEQTEQQHAVVMELQREVSKQKREWEIQKARMAEEKEQAINAAKFATQKLVDTVADFQVQVDAQKKVQFMLTKMLHEKEEELRIVRHKMSSINSITIGSEKDYPIDELYRSRCPVSDATTVSTSIYSSCSNCCSQKAQPCPSYKKAQLQHLFNMLTRTDEEPIRDT